MPARFVEHRLTRRRLAQLGAAASAGAFLGQPLPRLSALAQARATEDYDDGSDRIPARSAPDPECVIIIGAGWAGLTAANALRNAGVECVVLEARDRLGGRAWTVDVEGGHFDLGCSWIHQPVGNPLTRYAEQAGVAGTNADLELDAALIRFYDGVSRRELSAAETAPALLHALLFEEQAGDQAEQLGKQASIADGARAYLDGLGVAGDGRRRAEYLIRLFAELGDNLNWDLVSLDYWGNFDEMYTGIGQGQFPVGGYGRLIDAIGAGSDVRLEHRVRRIEQSAQGVLVEATTADHRGSRKVRLRGSHALITVPLGVLKRRQDIEFSPALPGLKLAAIERLGFGRFEKVAMLFDEPFWQEGGKTHILHLSERGRLESPLFIDIQRTSGFPALVCTSAGVYGRELERLPDAEVLRRTLAVLAEILARKIPDPREVRITNWGHDPFARGAYSTVLAPNSLDDVDLLAAPADDRILFAGEATSRRNGYADGAFSSGVREAKRLLQMRSVGLS